MCVCVNIIYMQYDTKYIYELGKHNVTRRFSFTTPPKAGPDVPYTFGLIGEHSFLHDRLMRYVLYYTLESNSV